MKGVVALLQKEIETKLLNIEAQLSKLAERQGNRANDSDDKILNARSTIDVTTAELEETAVTVADFLAEYYLSQLGVDDFDTEGGEEK